MLETCIKCGKNIGQYRNSAQIRCTYCGFDFLKDELTTIFPFDNISHIYISHIHSSTTNSLNIHSSNIYSSNIHNSNAHSSNVHNSNAHSSNIHNSNAHSSNIHNSNTHGSNIYSSNIHSSNTQSSNIHSSNTQNSNTHSLNAHSSNIHKNYVFSQEPPFKPVILMPTTTIENKNPKYSSEIYKTNSAVVNNNSSSKKRELFRLCSVLNEVEKSLQEDIVSNIPVGMLFHTDMEIGKGIEGTKLLKIIQEIPISKLKQLIEE